MKSSLKNSTIHLLCLLLLGGCAFLGGGSSVERKSETLRINFLSSQWKPIAPDTADYAVQNPVSGSVITANSMCKKYDSTSLKHLSVNMMGGIEDLTVLKEETLTYSGREALEMALTGKLDGVRIYMKTLTVRKDRCIYDFILIAPNERAFKKDRHSFAEFLKRLEID